MLRIILLLTSAASVSSTTFGDDLRMLRQLNSGVPLDRLWDSYKDTYDKTYTDVEEDAKRLTPFIPDILVFGM